MVWLWDRVKGHRLWRQAAIIHLLSLGFLISEMGLWKDPQQCSGENTQRNDHDKGTSLEGTGSCCFCCLRKPSASCSQRVWPGTELAVVRPSAGPAGLPAFTRLLAPLLTLSLCPPPPVLFSPLFVILDADENTCFRKAAGLEHKIAYLLCILSEGSQAELGSES